MSDSTNTCWLVWYRYSDQYENTNRLMGVFSSRSKAYRFKSKSFLSAYLRVERCQMDESLEA